MSRNKVLIVDDEVVVRRAVSEFLAASGFEVLEAEDCRKACELFQGSRPDAAVVDYALPDGTALELLPRLKSIDDAVPVIILTGHGTVELAVNAIKLGAEHFLTKPVQLAALLVVLRRSLENQRNYQKQLATRVKQQRELLDPFLGASAAIRRLAEKASKVCSAELPVLIHGETGTGKGVLARWLHCKGPRLEEPFVDLNCAGLSKDFLETELFGHEKGAFTGAVAAKPGLLELAHRGTVFLDEIGDVDPQVQPKLLKVLEEQQFRRMGEVRDRRVDIRLIAATHQDLQQLVQARRFREDLYFRISAVPLRVPPLRERREDIAIIAERLLNNMSLKRSGRTVALDDSARSAMLSYSWPGNIRELRNVLERAVLFSDASPITARDLELEQRPGAAVEGYSPRLTLNELERRHIELVLREEQWHVQRASKRLGIPRSSLYQKIKDYGIVTKSL